MTECERFVSQNHSASLPRTVRDVPLVQQGFRDIVWTQSWVSLRSSLWWPLTSWRAAKASSSVSSVTNAPSVLLGSGPLIRHRPWGQPQSTQSVYAVVGLDMMACRRLSLICHSVTCVHECVCFPLWNVPTCQSD